MTDDNYDAKFHVEQLTQTDNNILSRIMNIESAFDSLYEAVLKIASRTNTFGDSEIQAKLKEALDRRNQPTQN